MTAYAGAAGRLTRRQARILALVRRDLTSAQIAVRLRLQVEVVAREITTITARIDARRTLTGAAR